jgi:hypothetical protein
VYRVSDPWRKNKIGKKECIMASYNVNDKNSREYQENLYNGSRYNLLAVLIFTAVNLLILVTGGDSYWLFSASVPYFLTMFGMIFDTPVYVQEFVVGTFTITALVISAVILAAYLVCWIFSKKHVGFLIAALVMFAVDTLAFLGMIFLLQFNIAENLLDIVFHAWVIISLSRGLAAYMKMKQMPEPVEEPQPPAYTGPELD